MQTFLPYPDFIESVKVLDSKRLGKQRLEAYQILRTLKGETQGWKNHPAVRMWRGYTRALGFYHDCCIQEWKDRGFKNTFEKNHIAIVGDGHLQIHFLMPDWIGNEDFHRSHRANLVRKAPEIYVPLFGCLPPEPYVWPV
jgi:hypothetical protein